MNDRSGEPGGPTVSSLGLLDTERVNAFRDALEKILTSEIAEETFSEIIDGLPTKETWLEYDNWSEDHPVNMLGHETICDGAREKARRFRDELDIYILSFPSNTLYDFQQAKPGTKEYLLSLIELLARSCHEIAVRIFQLDDGIHKRSVYEAWRDAPVDPQANQWRRRRAPAAFFHPWYHVYKQYPAGIADVVGYWAETRIFGGVVVFDHGPSGVERKEVYIHGGRHDDPLTLFPPTSDQLELLGRYLLQPGDGPCPLPIESSILNGYRYHPHDAMSRYNVFRDRYERNEPQTRSDHRMFMDGRNWPEVQYLFKWMELQENKRWEGMEIDEVELAAVEEGMRRITPSSPQWVDPKAATEDSL